MGKEIEMFGRNSKAVVFGLVLICVGTLAWAEGDRESDVPRGTTVYPDEIGYHAPLHPLEIEAMNRAPGAPDGTYFLFIAASGAATPTDGGLDYSYSGGGCLQADANMVANGEWDTDIQIPEGHTVGGARFYYYDGDAGVDRASVFTFPGDGSLTLELNLDSVGDTGFGSVFDTLTVPANYSAYAIGLRFGMAATGSLHRACGVRLVILD